MSTKYQILEEYNKNLMYIYDILKKSTTTNNIELNNICKELFGDYYFIGVKSSDEFPKYIKNGQMFIINNKSSKSKTNGEHWLAFIKSDKNKDHKPRLYGYDSFNRDIHKLSPHFRHKRFVNANSNRDQSYYGESNCGERAVSWLISFAKWGEKVINII